MDKLFAYPTPHLLVLYIYIYINIISIGGSIDRVRDINDMGGCMQLEGEYLYLTDVNITNCSALKGGGIALRNAIRVQNNNSSIDHQSERARNLLSKERTVEVYYIYIYIYI